MEIRILHRQGLGIRAIARRLGVSPNTVRKALSGAEWPRYQRQVVRASKLDPYKDYLRARVKAAQPDWLSATVLYREITKRGYGGEISIPRDWLRTLKPRRALEPVVRFKSPEHAQRFLSAHGPINNLFRPRRHRMVAIDYCAARARAFETWQPVTCARTAN